MPSPATDSRGGTTRVDRKATTDTTRNRPRVKSPDKANSAKTSVTTDISRVRFGHKQMTRLGRILASDGMIGFMLGVVVVEAATLLFMHDKNGNAPEPVLLLSFLGAGAALMSSMFFVRRIEKSALPFATALLAALFFHLWHVALLWPR